MNFKNVKPIELNLISSAIIKPYYKKARMYEKFSFFPQTLTQI